MQVRLDDQQVGLDDPQVRLDDPQQVKLDDPQQVGLDDPQQGSAPILFWKQPTAERSLLLVHQHLRCSSCICAHDSGL